MVDFKSYVKIALKFKGGIFMGQESIWVRDLETGKLMRVPTRNIQQQIKVSDVKNGKIPSVVNNSPKKSKSSDEQKISNTSVKVTPVAAGTGELTAVADNGITTTADVTVSAGE